MSSSRDGFIPQSLSGWGRFPVERCYLFRPERQGEVARKIDQDLSLAGGDEGAHRGRALERSDKHSGLKSKPGAVLYH